MTKKEHQQRHIKLHKSLDELVADWLDQQDLKNNKSFSNTSIMELMEWSYHQTKNPTSKI